MSGCRESDLRIANALSRLVLAEFLGDTTEMPIVAEQRAHGGPLVGELTKSGERPIPRRRLPAQLADRGWANRAFQVDVQMGFG